SFLRRIVEANDQVFDTRGFRLLFEMGLDHWMREDTAAAMESFYLAEQQARNSVEKHFALFNLLLCLEATDLPRESVEERLETFLHKASDPSTRHLQEQWKAYRMRRGFYSRMELLELPELSGQAAFFQSWVRALPYFSPEWSNQNVDFESRYAWQSA